jgi:hypothetical protein
MPREGFKPMIPVFARAKTVHALDRASTVIGSGDKCESPVLGYGLSLTVELSADLDNLHGCARFVVSHLSPYELVGEACRASCCRVSHSDLLKQGTGLY